MGTYAQLMETIMIRYFKANVENARRIAVVEAETDDDIFDANEARRDREIAHANLPEDFASWKRYTAHGYDNSSVEVLSRHGD